MDMILTDDGAPSKMVSEIRAKGVEVEIVKSPG
jgi:hypothetical protein